MSGRQDSNLRPPGPKPGALPDCATPRKISVSQSTRPSRLKRDALPDCATPRKNFLQVFRYNDCKRWRGDSNPRYRFQYDSLANCWFKPLTHPTYGVKSENNHCLSLKASQRYHIFFYYKEHRPFFIKKNLISPVRHTGLEPVTPTLSR
jgi:hypothetical protein